MSRSAGKGPAVPLDMNCFYRPEDLAAVMRIGRKVVDGALRQFVDSGGKKGLPHSFLGKGCVILGSSAMLWFASRERAQATGFESLKKVTA